uniref:Uncharacterized protein n=1 Tax=Glossina brevipalpis TaxID=37001 RepID=A0A1A9WS14_9MUSC
MLVATPGQTATYALATGPSAKKATTLPSANTTNNNITGATKVLNSVGTASITANSSNSNNNNKNLNNSNSSSGHNNTFTFNTLKNALITATAVSSIVERKTINDEAIATKKATATTTTAAATTTTTTSTATTNASTIASLKTSSYINTSASTSTSSSNAAAAASAAAAAAVALLATPHKYPSATFLKLYAVSPTIIHRLPSEREQTSSTDSLNKEMCHFKPIRTAPTTPWKSGSKSRGISLRFPKANIATNPEFNKKPNCDVINRKEDKNRDMNHDRNLYENLKPKSSSSTLLLTRLLATPSHQSAFVCLMAQMENLTKMHTNLDNNGLQSNAKNVSDLRKISEFRRPKDVPSKLTKIQKKRSNSILTNTNNARDLS